MFKRPFMVLFCAVVFFLATCEARAAMPGDVLSKCAVVSTGKMAIGGNVYRTVMCSVEEKIYLVVLKDEKTVHSIYFSKVGDQNHIKPEDMVQVWINPDLLI